MERSRRDRFTAVAPTGDEFKVVVLLAGLSSIVLIPLVVQGVVGWITTDDYAWPNEHLLNAYAGLLHGRFGAGLRRNVANALPTDGLMWGLTVLGEVLTLGAVLTIGRWGRELTGASFRHGLATSTQAAEALGESRLRNSAEVIRPDLYARPQHPVRRSRLGIE